jgi:hypothetical protein
VAAVAVVSHARDPVWLRASGVLAAAAGKVTGRVLAALPVVPGIGGAVLVSLGLGEAAGHIFGHGLAPWTTIVIGGIFALLLDRRI